RPAMTQTSNRFFDEMARLMNDAAGVASGVRREFDTMFRNQADRILRDLDVVKREEFEAVKEMARLAREENEALKARIAALEAKLGSGGTPYPLASPSFFFSGGAGARFLSSPIVLAISAPNRRHGARLRQHGRSPHAAGEDGPHRLGGRFVQEGLHHGDDRQADEGGGAVAGRQGGRPRGASSRPRAGRDLRRRQAPAQRLG